MRLGIIAGARARQDQNIQKLTTAAAKPTVETKQTLFQELNSLLRPGGDMDAKAGEMFERWIR